MRLIDADALMDDIKETIENSGCVNHEGEILDCIRLQTRYTGKISLGGANWIYLNNTAKTK